MKYIILFLTMISFVFGQVVEEGIAFTTNQSYDEYLAELDAEYDRLHPRERVITFGDILDYTEECYADTIKAILFEGEYIVQFVGENLRWMLTEKQLEEKGYYYKYRWIINTIIDEEHPMEFEYIFIGKPTFNGFSEWIRSKQ